LRVFVTAIGIVSPLAVGAQATFQALVRGDRALRPITSFDVGASRSRLAAEVQPLDIQNISSSKPLARVDALGILAAKEALLSASLAPNAIVDLVTSGVQGGMFETEKTLVDMHQNKRSREPDPTLVMHPVSATADRLREIVYPFRRVRTISSACSGGAAAISLAEAWIRSGQSSAVLAGGADALCRFTFAGFHLLSSLDPEPCKPFDTARAGLNLGEGAAYLLLESEDQVRRRGVQPLAEMASSALASEAKHIIQPEENGSTLIRSLRRCLERAHLTAAEIDYINAHGTATPQSDVMEIQAYRMALGDYFSKIPISSCKGQIGHSLGAAAAMEAAITVLALHHGQVPPTGGLQNPDPRCSAHHVLGQGRDHPIRAALSVSAGFGGAIAVLSFTRPELIVAPTKFAKLNSLVVSSAATLGPLGFGLSGPSRAYLQDGAAPTPGSSNFSTESLDADKIRRFDNAATRTVLVAKDARDDVNRADIAADFSEWGIVTGLALRGGDAGASFLAPVLAANFRTGRPLVFPGLLPSSPASQASIYLGLGGPSLTTIDAETSSGSALSSAIDLIGSEHARAMIVVGLSEWDDLSRQSVGPVNMPKVGWSGPYTDGAAALVVERAEDCAARGIRPLAKIVARQSGSLQGQTIPEPADPERALVIVTGNQNDVSECLGASNWSNVRRMDIAKRAGEHEALGAMALAAAAHAIAAEDVDEVLLVQQAEGRLEVFLFAKP